MDNVQDKSVAKLRRLNRTKSIWFLRFNGQLWQAVDLELWPFSLVTSISPQTLTVRLECWIHTQWLHDSQCNGRPCLTMGTGMKLTSSATKFHQTPPYATSVLVFHSFLFQSHYMFRPIYRPASGVIYKYNILKSYWLQRIRWFKVIITIYYAQSANCLLLSQKLP
jgi:hypothetical protein